MFIRRSLTRADAAPYDTWEIREYRRVYVQVAQVQEPREATSSRVPEAGVPAPEDRLAHWRVSSDTATSREADERSGGSLHTEDAMDTHGM